MGGVFTQERHKDRLFGSTRKGPHRDDFSLLLNNRDARHYGSEGQQKRTRACPSYGRIFLLQQQLGIIPILLADDVLGELDASRRANFRKLLSPQAQTFSTGTSYPSENEKEMWETFEVNEGRFNPLISPVHND